MSELVPGVYERLITQALAEALASRDEGSFALARQQLDWLDDALARHVAGALRRALATFGDGDDALADRIGLVAEVLRAVAAHDDALGLPADLPTPTRDALTWVAPPAVGVARPKPPARPEHGLVHPSLLFNGPQDVSLLHELRREIDSADRVDAIVAFLKFSGFKLLEAELRRFVERGGALRVVCSTYTRATEARAVRALVAIGGVVRVAYEADGTRLHAKAWMFHRGSGLSTAYVGSSNLSRAALTDGNEWNVRVTEATTPALIERFDTAFEQFWGDLREDFSEAAHGAKLDAALSSSELGSGALLRVDVQPKPHQVDVLAALDAERRRGHWRNLVVAATGTGKTWVAAFDYLRLRRDGVVDRLLFVAHRKEILSQTLAVFRLVLQDPGFGELLVDGSRPARGQHVFASIQSLQREVGQLDPSTYSMVVVDEFHHAAAKTYQDLLDSVTPRVLLGLTATPERADGRDVFRWFDHRIASEVRLWDALEAGQLVPFHYYGVFDPGSAERAWERGRLVTKELENLYAADDARAARVVDAVARYVANPRLMRALGFCVGVGHAHRMARAFTERGLPALALDADTPDPVRSGAVAQLEAGVLCAIFTVDLFNEGVDIPRADTVLFLRPTESATVFVQQLGRGLRRHPDKAQLVVLDFVGHVHADYRYELRYQAILGGTRHQTREQIVRDFPKLPPGCAIRLEEQAREVVLAGIKAAAGGAWRRLVDDLVRLGPETTLGAFLDAAGVSPDELYRGGRGWTALRRAAGFETCPPLDGEGVVQRRVGRLTYVDDDGRLARWGQWLAEPDPPRVASLSPEDQALARMLVVCVGDRTAPVARFQEELAGFWRHVPLRRELRELLAAMGDRVRHVTEPLVGAGGLRLHGTYMRPEVIAGFEVVANGKLRESREGPVWVAHAATDVFFVTLDKSDDQFTPSIRYADYPLSPTSFHWESQNITHDGTEVGRRYVTHEAAGSRVLLMVRERRVGSGGETVPFTCLGHARYVRHKGAKPMQIVWALDHPMPAWMWARGRAFGG